MSDVRWLNKHYDVKTKQHYGTAVLQETNAGVDKVVGMIRALSKNDAMAVALAGFLKKSGPNLKEKDWQEVVDKLKWVIEQPLNK
jgi:hypothetical protein